ncbi:MAG: YkgJ family cysteine cluster protein [Candidatus Thorarchaeota archaeon]
MNELKNLRFVCTRCGNCCTDKDTLVNLTYLDILKIKNGLKLDIKEVLDLLGFYIYDKEVTVDDKKRMVIAPIETEKGLAFVALRKNSLGGCYFYNSEEKRCLIYNLRPMFCRTFPFTFSLSEENDIQRKDNLKIFLTEKGKKYCPGISKDSPLINIKKWIKLGQSTLKELEKNHILTKNWNDKVEKGKILPTAKKYILSIFKLESP